MTQCWFSLHDYDALRGGDQWKNTEKISLVIIFWIMGDMQCDIPGIWQLYSY